MFAVRLRALSRRRALLATTAATVIAGFGTVAHAATPIDTANPFYNQSDVGTTVNPDFQGGTLRDNVNAATDNHAYNVENFPTNAIDEFGNTVTFTGSFSGAGPLTFADSVGGGNAIFTGTSILGGAVTVNSGAALTWGNGTGGAFLIGAGDAVVDNGSLVMDFGGGGLTGAIPISGTGSLTIQSGSFDELAPSTYTGGTTVDAAGTLALGTSGGVNGSVVGNIVDNGLVQFNYAGAGPVTAPNTFTGGGSAEAVSGTVVITGASAVGGTVTIDGGATMQWGDGNSGFLVGAGNAITDNGALVMNFGGGGIGGTIPISGSGTVELVSGSLSDSGVSTYTGTTTIDAAGFLNLTGAGSISNSSDVIVNGTFDISGTAGTSITTLDGSGIVSLGARTLTLTAASGTFSGDLADGGLSGGVGGGLTIAAGTETLTGTNTYTGATTIDLGATLALGDGVSNGTVAGNIVDNGLVQFDYNGAATIPGAFTGGGSAEAVAGTVVITGGSAIGGNVTIDPGATMQWGDGGPGFLVGAGNAITDNGALVMNFGGGGIAGAVPISGSGTVELVSGSLSDSGVSTYTGTTTIDAAGFLDADRRGLDLELVGRDRQWDLRHLRDRRNLDHHTGRLGHRLAGRADADAHGRQRNLLRRPGRRRPLRRRRRRADDRRRDRDPDRAPTPTPATRPSTSARRWRSAMGSATARWPATSSTTAWCSSTTTARRPSRAPSPAAARPRRSRAPW